jgi:hypothetical protein
MANGQRQVDALDRQIEALELRASGMRYQDIADKLGYKTPGGAYKAVKSALVKTLQEPADELRTLEVERLDEMLADLWPNKHKPIYTDRILRIMERRAKLLGLDAPTKTDVTSGGMPIVTVNWDDVTEGSV